MRFLERVSAIWHTPESLTRLEKLVMATAADYAARLDAVSNELAGDLADLRTKLANATADEAARSAAEWAAALDGPISRLENMGKSEETPEGDGGDTTTPTPAPGDTGASSGEIS